MTILLRSGCLAAILCCSAGPAALAEAMVKLDLCDMKPVFNEEFDTLSAASRVLGPARWTAHTPWNGDFGDAAFADPGPGGPFAVKDGILAITASKGDTGRWRSGLLAAADSTGQGSGTQYGYFEARMRMPPGAGTWPAFWLASLKPAGDLSPGVEVDVVEYYGHSTEAYSSALHVWYKGADQPQSRHAVHRNPVSPGSLVEGFHTFGVRVAPDVLTYYFDRAAVWQVPTPSELKRPLFPLVNLALGSGFPIDKTPNPSILLVDYVHVYRLDAGARPTDCPASGASAGGSAPMP